MNGGIVRKAGEFSLSKRDSELFDYLCETISEKVMNRKPVYEKMIMDFSLLIARLIHNSILFELPSSFEKMVEIVEGYWFYSAHQEEDSELSFSYVRIYQNISMLKVYASNNRRENSIQEASVRYRKHRRIIQVVHDNPGLTHKDLSTILNMSPSNLTQRIASLIDQGYIYANRTGKYIYYALSNKGLELFAYLSEKNDTEEVSQPWTKAHVKALLRLLEIAEEKGEEFYSVIDAQSIKQLVAQLSEYDGEKIEEVLRDLSKSPRKEEDNFLEDFANDICEYRKKPYPAYMDDFWNKTQIPDLNTNLLQVINPNLALINCLLQSDIGKLMTKGMEYAK